MATKKKPARKQKPGTAKRAPAKLDGYYSGPMEWLSPMLEEAYMKLRPKEDAEAEAAAMAKPRRPRPVAKTAAREREVRPRFAPGIRDRGRALQLFRIESERLKLPAPFGRRIAEPLDADAPGQATFYPLL